MGAFYVARKLLTKTECICAAERFGKSCTNSWSQHTNSGFIWSRYNCEYITDSSVWIDRLRLDFIDPFGITPSEKLNNNDEVINNRRKYFIEIWGRGKKVQEIYRKWKGIFPPLLTLLFQPVALEIQIKPSIAEQSFLPQFPGLWLQIRLPSGNSEWRADEEKKPSMWSNYGPANWLQS